MHMDTTGLFPAAARYFVFAEYNRAKQIVQLFEPNAEVLDDGQLYSGHPEIMKWLTGPASEFTTISSRLGVETTIDSTVIRVRIEGNFPGGCVDLRFQFVESESGRIASLAITA